MNNDLLIYAIVALNVLVQLALIARLKFPPGMKLKFALAAVAIPALVIALVRALVAIGVLQPRLAEQSTLERGLTMLASLALILGPVGVTLAAVVNKRRRAWLLSEASRSTERP